MRIALVSSKGGVGKSALAITLAAEAQARGRSVLLVDGDHGQGTCLLWSETAGAAGKPAPTTIATGAGMHRPDQLPKVSAPYDVVVIDTPGRLSDVQRSALMFADLALVPTGPSASDAWALAPALDAVREAQALRPGLRAAVVITRKQARTAVGRIARQGLEGAGVPVLRTEIGYRVAWQECVAIGEGVTTYDRGLAALEASRLFDEIETLHAQGAHEHGQDATAAHPTPTRRHARR
jgi:chromosome partitioning protein